MTFSVSVTPRAGEDPRDVSPYGDGTLVTSQYGELLQIGYSTGYEERDGGWHGGYDILSWTVRPHGGQLVGMFTLNDPVTALRSGSTKFKGGFARSQPHDDGTVTFYAKGHCHSLYAYESWYAKTNSPTALYPTTQLVGGNLSTTFYGYELAEADGLPILYVDSPLGGRFPPGSWGAAAKSDQALKLGTVVTERLWEAGYRFQVLGPVLVVEAPTTDTYWRYAPPRSVVGIADDEYYSNLRLQYVNSATSQDAAVEYEHEVTRKKFGPRYGSVDYRGAAPMTSSAASALCAQLGEQVAGRYLVNGEFTITPTSGLTSLDGGEVRDISAMRAGHRIQLDGLRTSQGEPLPDQSSLIGRADYLATIAQGRVTDETLRITLANTIRRDLASLLAGKPRNTADLMSGAA